MPNRPATVIIQFVKAEKAEDDIWLTLTKSIDKRGTHTEADGRTTTVALNAKEFSLDDHQFMRIKVNHNKQDKYIHIPRAMVVMIVEGKEVEILGFSGSDKKSLG